MSGWALPAVPLLPGQIAERSLSPELPDKYGLPGGAGKGTLPPSLPPSFSKTNPSSPAQRWSLETSLPAAQIPRRAPQIPPAPWGARGVITGALPAAIWPRPSLCSWFPEAEAKHAGTFKAHSSALRESCGEVKTKGPRSAEQFSLQSLWANRAGPRSVRLPGPGPARAGRAPEPAHHSGQVAPRPWAHPRTQPGPREPSCPLQLLVPEPDWPLPCLNPTLPQSGWPWLVWPGG